MSHTPFIVAAYSIALVLLSWCALTPVLKGRQLRRFIMSRTIDTEEENDAPEA